MAERKILDIRFSSVCHLQGAAATWEVSTDCDNSCRAYMARGSLNHSSALRCYGPFQWDVALLSYHGGEFMAAAEAYAKAGPVSANGNTR